MGATMQTQNDSLPSEDQQPGKFAAPCEEIFVESEHVGTVYKWEDGIETAVWLEGSKPDGDCVRKSPKGPQISRWGGLFPVAV